MTAAVLDSKPDATWTMVARAQAGDSDAFAEIYRAYHHRVKGFIYKLTSGDVQLTEDLTADVFVRALANLQRLEDRGLDLISWLLTVARRLVADHYRSARVRRTAPPRFTVAVVDSPDEGPVPVAGPDNGQVDDDPMSDPVTVAEAHLARADLIDALKTLKPDYRQVIVLRYLNDLTLDETARALGRSKDSVKMLQHRALVALAGNETVRALAGAA